MITVSGCVIEDIPGIIPKSHPVRESGIMSLCHAGDTTKRSDMNATQARLPVSRQSVIYLRSPVGRYLYLVPAPSKRIGAKGKPLILVGIIGNPETIENDTVIGKDQHQFQDVYGFDTSNLLLSRYFSSSSTQMCEIMHFVSRMMSVTVFSTDTVENVEEVTFSLENSFILKVSLFAD